VEAMVDAEVMVTATEDMVATVMEAVEVVVAVEAMEVMVTGDIVIPTDGTDMEVVDVVEDVIIAADIVDGIKLKYLISHKRPT